jgi:D-xylose transport system permease protein
VRISAIVASSRQTFHSNDIGTLDELRVIAAAVIGGTALAGGWARSTAPFSAR